MPTSWSIALVVPITLVSDARSQIVVADGREPSVTSSRPTPYSTMTPSAVPTAAYAPGNALSASARVSTERTLSPRRSACARVTPGTGGNSRDPAGCLAHPPRTLAAATSVKIHVARRLRKTRFGAFVQATAWPDGPERSAGW